MEHSAGQIRSFETILSEIFPYTAIDTIVDVINIVEEENPNDSFEGKIENMINLLSGDGALGPMPNIANPHEPSSASQNEDLFQNLCTLFPDASESCLLLHCENKPPGYSLNDIVEEIVQNGYDVRETNPITVWEQLKVTLPNADPSYLQKEAYRLASLPKQDLDDFVEAAIENNDYPTMEDYLKTKNEEEEIALYRGAFNMENFLNIIPDPVKFYTDPLRKLSLDENSDENDDVFALNFLYNQYRFIRRSYIDRIFQWCKKNLVAACDRLDRLDRSIRRARPLEPMKDTKNIPLLQVTTFLKYRKQIKQFLKMKDESYRLAKEEARKYNLLETCQCCFDDELIPEECYFCMKDCVFCKDCVKRGAENVIGKADIRFPCFANCDSEFALHTLQMVLPGKVFARLTQRISSEEIKRANVEGLETCPFCDFAMILEKGDQIFKCINEDCLIESCRQCRQKSHIPLRCNEIEYDEDVRRRTYIENKMTEALTRTCYKCKKTFIKSTGCNKMTCSCGAKMCYLCGAAVNDYSHFDVGGCPLHTNDIEVNLQRILQSAERAKNELGNVEIKKDPSLDIRDFYQVNPSQD